MEELKKGYTLFSPWLRLFHWIMVVCVFVLFVTGLYIGDPGFKGIYGGTEPTVAVGGWFSMESIRRIHFSAGFILIASFVLRIYGACRYKGDRMLPKFNQRLYWDGLVEKTRHYLFWPQKDEQHYLRNSLARTGYLVVYLLFVIEIVTGLAMYVQAEPNTILASVFNPINLYFTEYGVHLIHHYVAWCFALFAVIHIYMAFRADIMEECGEVSSMISGKKFFAHDPADIGDIRDEK